MESECNEIEQLAINHLAQIQVISVVVLFKPVGMWAETDKLYASERTKETPASLFRALLAMEKLRKKKPPLIVAAALIKLPAISARQKSTF